MAVKFIDCTPETPWDKKPLAANEKVRHHKTREVGDQRDGYPGGDLVTVECCVCGERWEVELPQ